LSKRFLKVLTVSAETTLLDKRHGQSLAYNPGNSVITVTW